MLKYPGVIRLVTGVLIDTWWNVNRSQLYAFVSIHSVLIDTWWNVNMEWTSVTTAVTKF